MSKKFYAINRATGEKWKSRKDVQQYLVMYDSGYLAVVTEYQWDGAYVAVLDPKDWQYVIDDSVVKDWG